MEFKKMLEQPKIWEKTEKYNKEQMRQINTASNIVDFNPTVQVITLNVVVNIS